MDNEEFLITIAGYFFGSPLSRERESHGHRAKAKSNVKLCCEEVEGAARCPPQRKREEDT